MRVGTSVWVKSATFFSFATNPDALLLPAYKLRSKGGARLPTDHGGGRYQSMRIEKEREEEKERERKRNMTVRLMRV